MNTLPLVAQLGIFLLSAGIIWIAGIELAKTTDTLDTRFKLGDALGGLVLLGIATTLPEIAIIVSASLSGHYEIVLGTLVGGISIKALVVVILDFFVRGKRPLSYLAGSKIIVAEAFFVVAIAAVMLVGMRLPAGDFGISPISIVLALMWLVGIYLISRLRKNKRLYQVETDAEPARMHHERRAVHNHVFYAKKSNLYIICIFLLASVTTLIAGVLVEKSAGPLASQFGLVSGLFIGTILSLVASLPEISTGIESIMIKDNQLAVSDVLGGSALLPTIFIIGEFILGKPILPLSGKPEIIFAIIGIALTLVYAVSLIKKPKHRYFRLGADSIIVIILYVVGLFVLSRV